MKFVPHIFIQFFWILSSVTSAVVQSPSSNASILSPGSAEPSLSKPLNVSTHTIPQENLTHPVFPIHTNTLGIFKNCDDYNGALRIISVSAISSNQIISDFLYVFITAELKINSSEPFRIPTDQTIDVVTKKHIWGVIPWRNSISSAFCHSIENGCTTDHELLDTKKIRISAAVVLKDYSQGVHINAQISSKHLFCLSTEIVIGETLR